MERYRRDLPNAVGFVECAPLCTAVVEEIISEARVLSCVLSGVNY